MIYKNTTLNSTPSVARQKYRHSVSTCNDLALGDVLIDRKGRLICKYKEKLELLLGVEQQGSNWLLYDLVDKSRAATQRKAC
jgi:hypothetical protein